MSGKFIVPIQLPQLDAKPDTNPAEGYFKVYLREGKLKKLNHLGVEQDIEGDIAETDPIFSASAASGISTINIAQWNQAFAWGNHGAAGYLTQVAFNNSAAGSITTSNINNWNAAYSWGNHSAAGYLLQGAFNESPAGQITTSNVSNWDEAYNWGNHADYGYLSQFTGVTLDTVQSITALKTFTNGVTVKGAFLHNPDDAVTNFLQAGTDRLFRIYHSTNDTSNAHLFRPEQGFNRVDHQGKFSGQYNTGHQYMFYDSEDLSTTAGLFNISFYKGNSPITVRPLITINNGQGAGIFNTPLLKLFANGNLTLGISTDTGYKFSVNGGIRATSYVVLSGTSAQFLKADGTLDSNTYLTTGSASGSYVSLSGSYADPSWITTLAWTKITGAPAFLTAEADTLSTVTARGATTASTLIYTGSTEAIRPNVDSVGSLGASNFRWGIVYSRAISAVGNSLDIAGSNINLNDTSGNIKLKVFGGTGNVVIQDGGTFTDAGYRLDVQGAIRVTNNVLVNGSFGLGTTNPGAKYHQYQGQGIMARYDISNANTDQNRGVWDFYTNAAVAADFFGRFGFKFEGGVSDSFKQFQLHIADSVVPKLVVTGAGFVGIGTTAPTSKLQIATGSVLIDNNFSYRQKTASGGNIGLVYIDNSDLMGIYEGKINVTSTGNVGIGTTSPSERLHVAGTSVGITIDGTTASRTYYNRAGTYIWSTGLRSGDTKFHIFDERSADRFVIDDSGNVGIGTTTPTANLVVSSISAPTLKLENTNNIGTTGWVGTTISSLEFSTTDPSAPGTYARISTVGGPGSAGGGLEGDLVFSTAPLNTPGGIAERVRISSTGNVGIGTSGPAARLTVLNSATTIAALIGGGTAAPGWVGIGTVNSGALPVIQGYNNAFNAANAISINPSGGNVLVGTATDAGYRLDVNGTFRATGATVLGGAVTFSGTSFRVSPNEFQGSLAIPSTLDATNNTCYLNIGTFSDGFTHIVVEVELVPWLLGTSNIGSYSKTYVIRMTSAGAGVVDLYASAVTKDIGPTGDKYQLGTPIANGSNLLQIPVKFIGTGTGNQIAANIRVTGAIVGNIDKVSLAVGTPSAVSAGTQEYVSFRNRIGIGTTSPSAPLHVATAVTASSAIARGVYFNQTLTAAADNDVLVGLDIQPTYSAGAFTGVTNIALRVNGHISPTAPNSSSIGSASLPFNNGLFGGTVFTNTLQNYSSHLSFSLGYTTVARFWTTTGNFTLQNGGTFTDAGYRLDVNGTARVQSSAANAVLTGLRIANSAAASVTSGQGVQIDFANDNGFALSLSSSTIRSITTNTANGGADLLFLNYSGSALTEYMRITRLGNVGIGTTSPATKLHIEQTAGVNYREQLVKMTISDAGNDAFFISNGTSTNNTFWPAFAGYGSSATRSGLQFVGYLPASADASDSSDRGILNFEAVRTDNATDPTNGNFSAIQNRKLFTWSGFNGQLMTMLPNGNLGIGTTTPGVLLDVAGSIRSNSSVFSSQLVTQSIRINSATNLKFYTTGSVELMRLYDTGNLVLQNGGTFTDAGYRLDVQGTARVQTQLQVDGNVTVTNVVQAFAVTADTVSADSISKTGGTGSQFLKANGTVDENSYATNDLSIAYAIALG